MTGSALSKFITFRTLGPGSAKSPTWTTACNSPGHALRGLPVAFPPLRALPLRRNALHERGALVLRRADGRADAPADARRVPGGVDHLHALLPGGAPRGLRIRAR